MSIEDGRYLARAVSQELGITSTGKEQIAVKLRLEGEPDITRTWYGYFTEPTWERTLEALRLCGWKGDDLNDMSGMGDSIVYIVLKTEEYKGKYTQKVAFINSPNGGGAMVNKALEGDGLKSFTAMMKAKIKAKEAGTSPAARSAPKPTKEQLDDIPF